MSLVSKKKKIPSAAEDNSSETLKKSSVPKELAHPESKHTDSLNSQLDKKTMTSAEKKEKGVTTKKKMAESSAVVRQGASVIADAAIQSEANPKASLTNTIMRASPVKKTRSSDGAVLPLKKISKTAKTGAKSSEASLAEGGSLASRMTSKPLSSLPAAPEPLNAVISDHKGHWSEQRIKRLIALFKVIPSKSVGPYRLKGHSNESIEGLLNIAQKNKKWVDVIVLAACSRNIELLAKALKDVPYPQSLINKGESSSHLEKIIFDNDPMHFAARYDEPKLCDMLLSFGANIDIPSSGGDTPLHDALQFRSIKTAKHLIKLGANVLHVNRHDDSVLHKAVTIDELDIAREVLKRGAHVNHQNGVGNTPLHIALRVGNPKMIELLFDYKADLTIKNKHGIAANRSANALAAYEQWSIGKAVADMPKAKKRLKKKTKSALRL